MSDVLTSSLSLLADTTGVVTVMREYVAPTIRTLAALASIACVFFIINSGYLYMTSSGQPEKIEQAKRVLKNALLGLVIVLAAATVVSILSSAYGTTHEATSATLPSLEAIPAQSAGLGLVDILIKAVTGFLNNIIQTVAAPFLAALNYFTKATPLMAENSSVQNLWKVMVLIADSLMVIVLALIGLHVMSASSFGFEEVELKQLWPKIALVFVLLHTSIFIIDGVIELSNVLINAISQVSGSTSVWDVLTKVVKEAGGQGLAALLMMLAFLIFAVILLVYYVGRLVTLFIGAVLAPLVILLWIVPGFRDFSESAMKTYITTIFVLFVHVVILQLSASLFTGMSVASGNPVPDALISMVVGLATVMALLRTQSVMLQFSYASMGARNARKLGGQFINGISYMTGKSKKVATTVSSKTSSAKQARAIRSVERRAVSSGQPQSINYTNKKTGANITHTATPHRKIKKGKTGTTYEAPKPTPRPKTNGKDKTS